MTSLSPKLLAELDEAITSLKLDLVAHAIRQNACECFAMVAVEEDDYSSTGNTRFGGDPDLPTEIAWPTEDEGSSRKYCNFIAQVNLSELPSLGAGSALPESGVLYFFVRQLVSAADAVLVDVFYYKGDMATLRRTKLSSDAEYCDPYSAGLTPQRVKAIPAISLASYRKEFRQSVEAGVDEFEGEDGALRLSRLESDLQRNGQIGQLLGYANCHDDSNLYRQVALTRLGKREFMFSDGWDSLEEYEANVESWQGSADLIRIYDSMREGVIWHTANRTLVRERADEWRLLLQVDSNAPMNLNINDADPLYCFSRNDDLARSDFSDVAGEVTQG